MIPRLGVSFSSNIEGRDAYSINARKNAKIIRKEQEKFEETLPEPSENQDKTENKLNVVA